MLDNFIYVNHIGQRFEGLKNGVYHNMGSLRDYSWSYEKLNDRISGFYRKITSRKIPLVVLANDDEESVAVRNRLHEITEKDVIARKPGRVYVGNYYTTGYITGSAKSDFLRAKRLCKLDLTLVSDNAGWFSERTYVFALAPATKMAIGTDYPADYPYDYAAPTNGSQLVLDTITSNAFRLLIYGPCVNPSITIGGHRYGITGELNSGESLLIDSMEKTIMLTTASGTSVNWFAKRNRDSYIFEPIPPGKIDVLWNNAFGFDLTVIEERSEPKWT